jgi:hypothetical protein
MAGNLDFLKGMALESAQLAVSYVKGEGVSGPENGTTHNATAVSNLYLTWIVKNNNSFTCVLPVTNRT